MTFLPTNKIIPVIESVLRVFDRYGERSRRMKARMKYLLNDKGLETFINLIEDEQKALPYDTYDINIEAYKHQFDLGVKAKNFDLSKLPKISDTLAYETWKGSSVNPQKQKGFVSIGVKVLLGNFSSEKARLLANLIEDYAANELRFTLRQNLLIRHVRKELLPFFYEELKSLGFVDKGYNSTGDITACPGTDTCNLGIAGSTAIAKELEKVLREEYPKYLDNHSIFIKISGCMNACGQHNMSPIGFQGMSIKKDRLVVPALQVLLGGTPLTNGKGKFSDKVIKIPSKRGPQALRCLIDDFEKNASKQSFVEYYDKKGQTYFYDLLKPLANTNALEEDDFIDWGYDKRYVQSVGVGECAGVVIDLVTTLFFESDEKLDNARFSLSNKAYADSIYYSYAAMINVAKALLISEEKKTNTHSGIISDFDSLCENYENLSLEEGSFSNLIYQIKTNKPTETFAKSYLNQAQRFYKDLVKLRETQLERT